MMFEGMPRVSAGLTRIHHWKSCGPYRGRSQASEQQSIFWAAICSAANRGIDRVWITTYDMAIAASFAICAYNLLLVFH